MEVTSGRFAALIAPLSVDAFFAEYWERTPLHLRRDRNVYRALPTPREIDEIIASGVLRYPSIQLARGGGFLPPESFTRTVKQGDALFTGLPDVAQIETEYRSGATISLPGFHRVSPAVGALAAALADELDHAVHANVYLTPGNAAGFTPHYDTHETFILHSAAPSIGASTRRPSRCRIKASLSPRRATNFRPRRSSSSTSRRETCSISAARIRPQHDHGGELFRPHHDRRHRLHLGRAGGGAAAGREGETGVPTRPACGFRQPAGCAGRYQA